ncbi:7471_t:CDS:2, partial [Gigaspora margarita]
MAILPSNYNYFAIKFLKFSDYIIDKGFSVNQFEVGLMANINSIEANYALNSNYGYVSNLFKQFHYNCVGEKNGLSMFQHLQDEVNSYNSSRKSYAVLQEYNSHLKKAFILCIVTNMIVHIHEKVQQSAVLLVHCHLVLVISDELQTTLENGMNMLKSILSPHKFFGHGPSIGPITFLTNDLNHEHNALERFLCPGWEMIDATKIQQTEISMEYIVLSQKDSSDLFYTVNMEFCTCTCFVGLSGAPCKHQGMVAAKYHVGSQNFFPSLMSNDHACFAYIACGVIADNSFYASLHAHTNEFFETFLSTIKNDYEICGPQLQAALEKLAERYNVAKAKSIPALTSFLYSINHDKDPLVCVKSGAKIHIQVESIKCRKART